MALNELKDKARRKLTETFDQHVSEKNEAPQVEEISIEELKDKAFVAMRRSSDQGELPLILDNATSPCRMEKSAPAAQALLAEATLTPSPPPARPSGALSPRRRVKSEASKSTWQSTPVLLTMKKISERDRHIGQLVEMIAESERQLREREERSLHLEDMISAAKIDAQQVRVDFELGQERLALAEQQRDALVEHKQQYFLSLEGDGLKQRLNALDSEMGMLSARSSVSTATGISVGTNSTFMSTCRWTPRLGNVSLEPLQLR